MDIRRTATWQRTLDERILEALRDDGPASIRYLAAKRSIFATAAQVRARCRLLASVDLVEPHTRDWELFELTGDGRRYLEGELDVSLRWLPHPRGAAPVRYSV